jgi:outer membrane biosynthesis protein TonB
MGGGPDSKTPPRPIDAKKIIEEIQGDYDRALKDLEKDNPSADARQAQQRIAEGIKKLLEQQDPPSQSSKNSANAPKPQNSQAKPAPESKPQPSPSQPKPHATPSPAPKPQAKATPAPNSAERKSSSDNRPRTIDEAMKMGDWPSLPSRVRSEIDAIGRDPFMERYNDLLREYYRSLAENNRREKSN